MIQSLEVKHVLILMVATCAALGFFFWNRTCILSAEIEQLSAKVDQWKEQKSEPVVCSMPHEYEPTEPEKPRVVRERKKKVPEIDPEIEVVYGGEESRRMAESQAEK